MPELRFVEVCAGIGGFSLAASWTGWNVVGQVEIDPWCRKVLAKHWPDTPRLNDIHDVQGHEFGEINVLAGGIPCQPFSVAGAKRGVHDPRHLWPDFLRIVKTAQPDAIVVENVAGFVNMALDTVQSDLEEANYTSRAIVIPASAVNAPHKRERVWVLAHPKRPRRSRLLGGSGLVPGLGVRQAVSPGAGSNGTAGPSAGRLRSDQSGMAHAHDGIPRRLVDPRWNGDPRQAFAGDRDDWERDVPRMIPGYSVLDLKHKVRAMGNALVPQVAYELFLALDAAMEEQYQQG